MKKLKITPRILILEDNKSDAELELLKIKEEIEFAQFKIVGIKKDFIDGIRLFKPDLVISDYSLPDWSGLDALKFIKKHYPFIPIILVTGTQTEEVAVECMKQGALDYILKDNLKRLPSAVTKAIKHREISMENAKNHQAYLLEEQRFRTIFNDSAIGIALVSTEGKIVEANPALQKMLGFTENELAGKLFVDFTHPEERQIDAELFDDLIHEKFNEYQIEKRFICKNGEIIWAQLTNSLIKNVSGEDSVIKMVENVTERRKVVNDLKISNERLKIVLQNAPILLFTLNKKGIFTLVEGTGLEGTAINPDELLGKSASRFFTELKFSQDKVNKFSAPEIFKKVISGESFEGNLSIAGAYFEIRLKPLMDNNMRVLGVIGISINITGIKEAEEVRENLLNEVVSAETRLKFLSRRLLEVQEKERRHIARELHDEIGQLLTALKIDLQSMKRKKNSDLISDQLLECLSIADTVLKHVRNLSLNLRPSLLDDLGLIPAVKWYIDKQTQRSGLNAEINTSKIEKKLSPELEITCYRLVQEAITNIMRHAGAKNIKVGINPFPGNY